MMQKRFIETKWFRVLPFVLAAVLLLLIAVGIAAVVRWRMSVKDAAAPVLLDQPVYQVEGEPAIGTRFDAVMTFRLPWSDTPKLAAADPGVDLQLTADPFFERSRIRWGYSDWTLRIPLQAYRSGEGGGGTVQAEFFGGEKIDIKLPAVKISDLTLPLDDTGTDLSLAPRLDASSKQVSKLAAAIIAAAVILIAALVWFLLARKKRAAVKRIPTIWERALDAIRSLRLSVHDGNSSPERAVADLTDIVRRYLESRFHLRAERQTTAEFLADLERNDRLLEEKHRKFLRSFLASADMVKFARLPAGDSLFDKASERAEELISGTVPHDDNGSSFNPGGSK